jgi:hypothetical protein
MLCAYCGRRITEIEMKNETFISIREFRYGKKGKGMEFPAEGLTKIVHRRCFVPSDFEEHPCKRGLVE